MRTTTVGQLRRLLDGIPDDQPLLLIDPDGFAAEIDEIDPLTATDQRGTRILTLEFTPGEVFGFDPEDGTRIDTGEAQP